MEVYHRLRIFEGIEDDGSFPFISASLNISLPKDSSFICSARYVSADSTFEPSTKLFHTDWEVLDGGNNIGAPLFLYSSINSEEEKDAARIPTISVISGNSGTEYATDTTPYKVNEYYHLMYSGGLTEYVDLTDVMKNVSGFNNKTFLTDRVLLACELNELYGPFTRSMKSLLSTSVEGSNLPTPSHKIYHITRSHWIDTSKLVTCDPTAWTAGLYSDAITANSTPGEPTQIVSAIYSNFAEPANYDDNTIKYNQYEYRYNSGILSPKPETEGAARAYIFRPKVNSQSCANGYKVYVSSIMRNVLHTSTDDYNNEYAKMYFNTKWDWVNIQLWQDDTYLSADCLIENRNTLGSIHFSNVVYFENGTSVDDDTALKVAENTIGVVTSCNNVHTYVIIKDGSRAIICTTELASSINQDNSWSIVTGYESTFYEGGSRYAEGQTYEDSPDNISMQYKIYASTETLHDTTKSYFVNGHYICDEYHYLTSSTAYSSVFSYHNASTETDKNNKGWNNYVIEELYTGIKWANVDYDPSKVFMPSYINTLGMNVLGTNIKGAGCITESYPFITIDEDTDIVPAIVWNLQDIYCNYEENHVITYESAGSRDEAKAQAISKAIASSNNGRYYVTYRKYAPADTPTESEGFTYYYTGSETALTETYPKMDIGLYNRNGSFTGVNDFRNSNWNAVLFDDNMYIDMTKLHGVDNGRFIAYIKFDSDINRDLTLTNYSLHLYCMLGSSYSGSFKKRKYGFEQYFCFPEEISEALHQMSDFPESLQQYVRSIYTYDKDDDSNYNYTLLTGTDQYQPKIDTWYGIIVSPDITNVKTYDGNFNNANEIQLHLCEITDEDGNIKEEHQKYLNLALNRRYCNRNNKNLLFNVTYNGVVRKWSIDMDDADFNTYFETRELDDKSIQVKFKSEKRNAFQAAYPNAFINIPAADGDVCVDIDQYNAKVQNLFNSNFPICIPEYSGCTFVKYDK